MKRGKIKKTKKKKKERKERLTEQWISSEGFCNFALCQNQRMEKCEASLKNLLNSIPRETMGNVRCDRYSNRNCYTVGNIW